MWRDVFLNNKEAVLEMLGRFTEDLTNLQRAIRYGEGDTLLPHLFTEASADSRTGIIEAGQDTADAPTSAGMPVSAESSAEYRIESANGHGHAAISASTG